MVGRVLVWPPFCLLSPCLFAPEVFFSHQGGDKKESEPSHQCVCGRNNTLKNRQTEDLTHLLRSCWFVVFTLIFCFSFTYKVFYRNMIKKVDSVAKWRKMGIDNEAFDSFVTERSRFLGSAAVPD